VQGKYPLGLTFGQHLAHLPSSMTLLVATISISTELYSASLSSRLVFSLASDLFRESVQTLRVQLVIISSLQAVSTSGYVSFDIVILHKYICRICFWRCKVSSLPLPSSSKVIANSYSAPRVKAWSLPRTRNFYLRQLPKISLAEARSDSVLLSLMSASVSRVDRNKGWILQASQSECTGLVLHITPLSPLTKVVVKKDRFFATLEKVSWPPC
jgi:hypothetical protein